MSKLIEREPRVRESESEPPPGRLANPHLVPLRGMNASFRCIPSGQSSTPDACMRTYIGERGYCWFKDHGIIQHLALGVWLYERGGGGSTEWTDTSQFWKHEHNLQYTSGNAWASWSAHNTPTSSSGLIRTLCLWADQSGSRCRDWRGRTAS